MCQKVWIYNIDPTFWVLIVCKSYISADDKILSLAGKLNIYNECPQFAIIKFLLNVHYNLMLRNEKISFWNEYFYFMMIFQKKSNVRYIVTF